MNPEKPARHTDRAFRRGLDCGDTPIIEPVVESDDDDVVDDEPVTLKRIDQGPIVFRRGVDET
jgi:hypothetical protein